MIKLSFLFIVLLVSAGFAQDFFDDQGKDENNAVNSSYELNGFMRGAIFGGNTVIGNQGELGFPV